MNELQRYLVEEAVEDLRGGAPHAPRGLKAIAGITGTAARGADAGGAGASRRRPARFLRARRPWSLPDDPSIVAGIAEFQGRSALDGTSRGPLRRAAFPSC